MPLLWTSYFHIAYYPFPIIVHFPKICSKYNLDRTTSSTNKSPIILTKSLFFAAFALPRPTVAPNDEIRNVCDSTIILCNYLKPSRGKVGNWCLSSQLTPSQAAVASSGSHSPPTPQLHPLPSTSSHKIATAPPFLAADALMDASRAQLAVSFQETVGYGGKQ